MDVKLSKETSNLLIEEARSLGITVHDLADTLLETGLTTTDVDLDEDVDDETEEEDEKEEESTD